MGKTPTSIYFNKLAIESPYVRSALNRCIDIIFGYKSCGEKARKVENLYHPFCYILYNSYYRIPLSLDSYHKNGIIKTFDEKIITSNLNQINDTPIYLSAHSNPITTLSIDSKTNNLVIGDSVGSVSCYNVAN